MKQLLISYPADRGLEPTNYTQKLLRGNHANCNEQHMNGRIIVLVPESTTIQSLLLGSSSHTLLTNIGHVSAIMLTMVLPWLPSMTRRDQKLQELSTEQ
jgi:hypothetical protein